LSRCESEPLHIPGAIQPHGALLVLDPLALTIIAASDNTSTLLGLAPEELMGRTLASLAVFADAADLAQCLQRGDLEEYNPLQLAPMFRDRYQAFAHRHDGRLIVEFEPQNADTGLQQANCLKRVHGSLVRLRSAANLSDLCRETAQEMRRLTGFDRVIVYAFRPDWSGEVVAEASDSVLTTYLGLRFPASDIPEQARALYRSCRLRMIPSSRYTPATVLSLKHDRPLDLTHATLRSISPFHLEYMRNMGVTASLGISLIVGDQLWGLITCNHESGERFIPYRARSAYALVGEVVSSLIGSQERLEESSRELAYLSTEAKIIQFVARDRDVVRGLVEHSPSLLDVANSNGAALCYGGEIHCVGVTPSPAAIADLLIWIDGKETELLALNSLPQHYAPSDAWKETGCGLLASLVSFGSGAVAGQRSWLLWFRPELAQTVLWGGDPRKPALNADGEDRPHPRASFETWQQVVRLSAAPFLTEDIAAARSLAAGLRGAIVEIESNRRVAQAAEAKSREAAEVALRERRLRVESEARMSSRKMEAVGTLAAGIAHDFNTILGSILGFAEMTLDELPVDSTASANLAQILSASFRARDLVARMLAFSRQSPIEPVAVDVVATAREALVLLRASLPPAVQLSFESGIGAASPPATLLADPTQIQQIVMNLCINAAYAMDGNGLVTVRVAPASESSSAPPKRVDGVCLTVTDCGSGIVPEVIERMFDPFFTTKGPGEGSGLGLSVVYGIVSDLGGLIEVDSCVEGPNTGTQFRVFLPIIRHALETGGIDGTCIAH
jgi:light-regulated signal transduction histidine kinase (bacteriophytochrome)